MALFGKLISAAGALFVATGALGAQATAPKVCDAEVSKGPLARVAFSVEQGRTAQGPAAATALSSAVKQLESTEGADMATGRSLLLGQTLAIWLGQPGMSPTPKRATVGFTKNPDATIDLVGAIDSLFREVETAKPNCVDLTSGYRGGLPGFINLANASITALNADKVDSAEYYATQANRLFPASPYGAMVLGNVASKRGDNAKAIQFYTAAATAAAKDSSYRDVERQMLYNAGSIYLSDANAASGADRAAAARHAAESFRQLLAVPGTKGVFLTSGRSSYQNALLLSGDTAAFATTYAPMLSTPASYDYLDLLNSAVAAARANRAADAANLFEASLAQNPYSRDALFNLGLTYLTLERNDKVVPVVTRLVALDPANPENYNLAARAFLAQSKAASAAKKMPLVAAYNDSTMQWYSRGNKLPIEVSFTQLNPTEKQMVIGGTVTDRRDKIEAAPEAASAPAKGAKKAAAAPKAKPSLSPAPVTLKFEALDDKGNVVGSQSVTTEALSPGAKASFNVTIPAANAVGFRYSLGG
jgi:tetratricopeptide (TPR) repeat protein